MSAAGAVVAALVIGALGPGLSLAADAAPRRLLLDGARVGHEIVAVGELGTILRTSDAVAWHAVPRAARATLTAVSFAPPASGPAVAGWAVGHDALILATNDGGGSWNPQYRGENIQDSFLDVLALDANHVIAIGAYALCVETKDRGKTWARRKIIEDDFHLNRLSVGPTGTLYLAGEHGTLLRSTDSGERWQPMPTDYSGSFYGVLPLDRRTLLAYGLRGHVYRSTDDGATWQAVATPQPVLLATAVKLRSNHVLLAGYAGTLLLSRDSGATFTAITSPTKAIAELLELPDGNLLALGETGATVISAPP